jgi:hypothetical protein
MVTCLDFSENGFDFDVLDFKKNGFDFKKTDFDFNYYVYLFICRP